MQQSHRTGRPRASQLSQQEFTQPSHASDDKSNQDPNQAGLALH
uniref:Uncharacterized protein n=1 Tax=Picea glauca TaxID=3330 RepID=A0A117NGS2_PICGL|nr:hypothetical protein ABT39_MTgene5423 [Picea glauca]